MDYKLRPNNGKIRYITKQISANVETETQLSSAEWMLNEGKPFRSDEFEGFPVGVEINGTKYFFAGEWPVAPKKRKTRRKKDAVCGNDYCELE